MDANTRDDKWSQCINPLQQGLNTAIHKTIRDIPSKVMFRYRLRMDSDRLVLDKNNGNIMDVTKKVLLKILMLVQYKPKSK